MRGWNRTLKSAQLECHRTGSRTQRVCLFTEFCPDLSTVERWAATVQSLRRCGVEAEVWLLRGTPGNVSDFEKFGVSARCFFAESVGSYPRVIRELRRSFLRERTIVHAFEPIQGVLAGVAATSTRTRVLYHRQHQRHALLPSLLGNLASGLADLRVSPSLAARPSVKLLPWEVALGGVSDFPSHNSHTEASRRLGFSKEEPTCVVVGRMRREKGQDLVIRAMADPRLKRCRLILVGDGPFRVALESLAVSLEVTDRVFFVGHSDCVSDYLALADVVCIPSRREAFGFAAAEAMMAGKPIVATRVGALAEIMRHESSALLVSPKADAVAGGLERLLREKELAERLGKQARAVARTSLTMDAMAARWRSIYESLGYLSPVA